MAWFGSVHCASELAGRWYPSQLQTVVHSQPFSIQIGPLNAVRWSSPKFLCQLPLSELSLLASTYISPTMEPAPGLWKTSMLVVGQSSCPAWPAHSAAQEPQIQ